MAGILDSRQEKELIQGNWYHGMDSSASWTISGDTLKFAYKGMPLDSTDIYTISFTKELPEYAKSKEKSSFLVLHNKTDTLRYEILGLSDSVLSLMHFPSGKLHQYRRGK